MRQNSTKRAMALSPDDNSRDMDIMHALPNGSLKHFLMYECIESIYMAKLVEFFQQNPQATLKDAESSIRQHSRNEHIKAYWPWAKDYPK